MLDATNALLRRQMVSTLVNSGLPTTKIASKLGVPVNVVRSDRVFLSTQETQETKPRKVSVNRKPALSREERRAANSYQKIPEVAAARRVSVARLCAEGKTDIQISVELGVSPTTVVRDRIRLGIPPHDFDESKRERRARVKAMMAQGVKKSDMARILGVNKVTILKDCEILGGKPIKQSVLAAERRVTVREMLAEKAPVSRIARELNVAEMTIRRDLERISKEDDMTK